LWKPKPAEFCTKVERFRFDESLRHAFRSPTQLRTATVVIMIVRVIALVCTVLVSLVDADSLRLSGTGFHRKASFIIDVPTNLDAAETPTRIEIRLRFHRRYFVDPFEMESMLKTTTSAGWVVVDGSVRTTPHRVDLEAPEFSSLASDEEVEVAFAPVGPRVGVLSFDVPVHGRYAVPAAGASNGLLSSDKFCVDVAQTSGLETLCTAEQWRLPRGDMSLLAPLYWSTIGLMSAGCLVVIHALVG
jgi:hypothetical protein